MPKWVSLICGTLKARRAYLSAAPATLILSLASCVVSYAPAVSNLKSAIGSCSATPATPTSVTDCWNSCPTLALQPALPRGGARSCTIPTCGVLRSPAPQRDAEGGRSHSFSITITVVELQSSRVVVRWRWSWSSQLSLQSPLLEPFSLAPLMRLICSGQLG